MSETDTRLPSFEVHLEGQMSIVKMDGEELHGVRDVKVHQPLEGKPTVTVEFLALSVTGLKREATR